VSRPPIREVALNDPRLSMHLCHRDSEHPEGFWLYDKDAYGGMNLAMGAPSEIAALIKAVNFWKERAKKSEAAHTTLAKHVVAFVNVVAPPTDDDGDLT
jgi:hypothetical protein